MKYLIINGSPRRKNTWSIVKEVKKNLNGEFEEIHLLKEQIEMCNGCFNCIKYGEYKCPHSHKIQPIINKIRYADGIIIASPVYAMNVSGILKNFFDHTAYLYHRPEFFYKKALIIVTTAGAGNKKVAKYIDETLHHWGVNKAFKIVYACGGKDELDSNDITSKSKKFETNIKSNKLSSPSFKEIIYFNVWKAMASSSAPIPADKKYWHESNLINLDYYPKVKLNIFKKLFSKIIFSILKKVM